MSIEKDIEELVGADVISRESAQKIQTYYAKKKGNPSKRMFAIFGILGAVLVGLGIILIVAHNWDELSRGVKSLLAFAPLLLGQILCGFVLARKSDSMMWREGSAAFLFMTVGASIALVSQTYNIIGVFSDYILTWMLLCLPMIYLMRSSLSSLFYLIGITTYAFSTGYSFTNPDENFYYWPLLLAIAPRYYWLFKNEPEGNASIFHHWFVVLSVVLSLGTLAGQFSHFMFWAYTSLFGLLFLIGQTKEFQSQTLRNNSYKIIGSLGTVYMLLHASFSEMWEDVGGNFILLNELVVSPELITSLLLSVLAGSLLYHLVRSKTVDKKQPLGFIFLIFIPIFILGMWFSFSVILINMLVLALGIWIIKLGADNDRLGQLNFGLIIVALLVICRFFDTDLSFVVRGALFMLLGVGFFITNYWLLKRRKTNEE